MVTLLLNINYVNFYALYLRFAIAKKWRCPISHHKNDPVCPLCEEKLVTAHPDLAQWFRGHVKLKFEDAHISWAWRSREDQELMFKEGRTRAHWPSSAHNAMEGDKPCARALDLFQIGADNVARFSGKFYLAVNLMIESAGSPIDWGGKWKSFGDADHFQLATDK